MLAACFDGRVVGVSYTQLGLGLFWLEHLCWGVVWLGVVTGLVAFRLFLRLPGELGG